MHGRLGGFMTAADGASPRRRNPMETGAVSGAALLALLNCHRQTAAVIGQSLAG